MLKNQYSGKVVKVLLTTTLITSLLVLTGLSYSPVLAAPKAPAQVQKAESFAPQTIGISLVTGPNLISLPLIPSDTAIGDILAAIAGSVNSVWAYDPTTQSWSSWTPAIGGDLANLTDGYGYWITMTAPATLNITGVALPDPPAVPPTYSMVTGWNLVGFKETAIKTNAAYLTGTNYRFPIYGYAAGAYTTISAGTENFAVGAGYWVYFNADGIVTP